MIRFTYRLSNRHVYELVQTYLEKESNNVYLFCKAWNHIDMSVLSYSMEYL